MDDGHAEDGQGGDDADGDNDVYRPIMPTVTMSMGIVRGTMTMLLKKKKKLIMMMMIMIMMVMMTIT